MRPDHINEVLFLVLDSRHVVFADAFPTYDSARNPLISTGLNPGWAKKPIFTGTHPRTMGLSTVEQAHCLAGRSGKGLGWEMICWWGTATKCHSPCAFTGARATVRKGASPCSPRARFVGSGYDERRRLAPAVAALRHGRLRPERTQQHRRRRAAFFRVSLSDGGMHFLAEGQFLTWSPDGSRFCTAPGRDTWTYPEKRGDGAYKTVWAAPLLVSAYSYGKLKTITPGLVWVVGADWRKVNGAMKIMPWVAFALALALTWALTPLVQKLAFRFGAVAVPRERDVHKEPLPRWGGLAMVGAFLLTLGLVYVYIATHRHVFPGRPPARPFAGVLLAALLVAVIGTLDDKYEVSALWQSLALIAAGVVLVLFDVRIEGMTNPFAHPSPHPPEHGYDPATWLPFPLWFSALRPILWVFGVAKTVDFIDGLDGLAAGVCAICGATLALMSAQVGQYEVTIIAATLVGVCSASCATTTTRRPSSWARSARSFWALSWPPSPSSARSRSPPPFRSSCPCWCWACPSSTVSGS